MNVLTIIFIAAITQHIPGKSFQTCTELAEVWCVITAGIQTNLADYAKNRAISHQTLNRLMKLMKLSR
ncbi:MAG TPA: hypothetical protein VI727_02835 [Candidatus Brocadiaceae bacterium]|nr:hypothetical protein [Candidatus Brocadiaceae bacterium]